jgi:nitrogen regulatory protein PII-like uncharacterized protein
MNKKNFKVSLDNFTYDEQYYERYANLSILEEYNFLLELIKDYETNNVIISIIHDRIKEIQNNLN